MSKRVKQKVIMGAAGIVGILMIASCQQSEVVNSAPVATTTITPRQSITIGGDSILSIMRIGPKGVIMAFNPEKISGQEMQARAAAVCVAQGDVLGDEYDVTDPVYEDRWPAGTKWFVFHCD